MPAGLLRPDDYARVSRTVSARGPLHCHRRRARGGLQDLWGRQKRSGLGRLATGANACPDQPPTSAPSRAGIIIWRAAGLLHMASRRIDCDDCAAGQCAPLIHHLLPSRFRQLPAERPACAPRSPGDFHASRPDTANHLGPLPPRPAGGGSASRDSASALRTANRVLNRFPVRFSPLVSGALGEAARQIPAHRRTSTAYANSE